MRAYSVLGFFVLLVAVSCSRGPTPGGAFSSSSPAPFVDEMGHSGGNGGDLTRPEDGAAWFLGSRRKIETCLVVAPGFGYGPEDLKILVDKAMATWGEYLETKQVYYATGGVFEQVELALKLDWKTECTGNEALKFYFGVSDGRVKRAKAGYEEPLGFAQPLKYDVSEGWGKGFIWIAAPGSVSPAEGFPDWKAGTSLTSIVMHEIGHMLGSAHVPGTIMDADIAVRLERLSRKKFLEYPHVREWLSSIDQERELYFCETCGYRYEGYVDEGTALEKLVGKKRIPWMARIEAPAYSGYPLPDTLRYDLVLEDDMEPVRLPLELMRESARRITTGVPIFRVVTGIIPFPNETGPHRYQTMGGDGWSYLGWITAKSGTRYPVHYEINFGFDESLWPVDKIDLHRWSVPLQIQGGADLNGGRTFFQGNRRYSERKTDR